MMNPESQAEFDRIVAIEPVALTDHEISFLRARRDYLTEEQKAVYKDVLAGAEAPVEAQVETPETSVAAPTGRGRKTSF